MTRRWRPSSRRPAGRTPGALSRSDRALGDHRPAATMKVRARVLQGEGVMTSSWTEAFREWHDRAVQQGKKVSEILAACRRDETGVINHTRSQRDCRRTLP